MYQEDQISKVIVNYFQNLFSSVEGERKETINYALLPIVTNGGPRISFEVGQKIWTLVQYNNN